MTAHANAKNYTRFALLLYETGELAAKQSNKLNINSRLKVKAKIPQAPRQDADGGQPCLQGAVHLMVETQMFVPPLVTNYWRGRM